MVPATAPEAVSGLGQPVVINNWKLGVKQVVFDQVAISAVDETVSPPLKLSADKVQLRLQLAAEQAGADFKLTVADAAFSLADLALASGAQTPIVLAQMGFADGALDLAARARQRRPVFRRGRATAGHARPEGPTQYPESAPLFGAASKKKIDLPWTVVARNVELSKFGAEIEWTKAPASKSMCRTSP